MTKTAAEMVTGFDSIVAPVVNNGDFLQGFDNSLSGYITPVFND